MEIPKAQILDMPKQRGDDGQAAQADQELPDRVDPERDSGLLARFGIDPQDLLSKLGAAASPACRPGRSGEG